MKNERDEFEVLSRKELKSKYYDSNELPPCLKLNHSLVPEQLRQLIPLAEKWGISDDVLREEAVEHASRQEVDELKSSVKKYKKLINDWLAGPEADNPPFSPEYLAFTHMIMASDGY